MAEFEVILGGSGRWVAREVLSRYSNGKIAKTGRVFSGHCPKKVPHEQKHEVIKRQIRRAVQGGQTASVVAPRGGSNFVVTVET